MDRWTDGRSADGLFVRGGLLLICPYTIWLDLCCSKVKACFLFLKVFLGNLTKKAADKIKGFCLNKFLNSTVQTISQKCFSTESFLLIFYKNLAAKCHPKARRDWLDLSEHTSAINEIKTGTKSTDEIVRHCSEQSVPFEVLISTESVLRTVLSTNEELFSTRRQKKYARYPRTKP